MAGETLPFSWIIYIYIYGPRTTPYDRQLALRDVANPPRRFKMVLYLVLMKYDLIKYSFYM